MLSPLANHPHIKAVLAFILKHLPVVLGLTILAAAVYFLWNDFAELDWSRTVAQLKSLSPLALLAAVGLTILNFLVLTFYDVLALKHTGYRLPYPRVALTSFIAYAFSGNLGVSILTGGAVRYRFYTRWGVKPRHIAHIMVFAALTLGLGLFAIGGVMLLGVTDKTFPGLPISSHWLDVIGVILLAVVAGYLVLCRVYHKPITYKGVTFSLPPLKLSLLQIGVAVMDWIICAGVLYVLLLGAQTDSTIPLHTFFLAFLIAQIAGVNSHVPGGVGVFDGLMLLMLKPYFPVEETLGILLAYRSIYYLLPFVTSLTLFGLSEFHYGVRKRPKPPTPSL